MCFKKKLENEQVFSLFGDIRAMKTFGAADVVKYKPRVNDQSHGLQIFNFFQ